MNFGLWLLKRMQKKLFGGQWGWLYKYRELIREEMPISIILTVLLGALWTIALGIIFAYFVDDRHTLQTIMKCIISCPPLFFVYNWIYGLYEIYDSERMKVWEELKR